MIISGRDVCVGGASGKKRHWVYRMGHLFSGLVNGPCVVVQDETWTRLLWPSLSWWHVSSIKTFLLCSDSVGLFRTSKNNRNHWKFIEKKNIDDATMEREEEVNCCSRQLTACAKGIQVTNELIRVVELELPVEWVSFNPNHGALHFHKFAFDRVCLSLDSDEKQQLFATSRRFWMWSSYELWTVKPLSPRRVS